MEIATDDSFMIIYLISIVAMGIMITIIGNCLCCRRNKVQKDEFSGVEGMVKIKNLDDGDFASNTNLNASASNVIELKLHGSDNSSNCNHEMKRVANAPHRSLPDLPAEIGDGGGDNNSDLYATVGDKTQQKASEKSPSTLKKQTSISQHSSISQADDFSSPYARVRSPPHAYDKVKRAEHPYAQVGSQPGPMLKDQSLDETDGENSLSQRQSNSSLADIETGTRQEIPAASAIAGRISASQDLPYMTPPIVQPQLHFSGDSQDSSKGYTSISVREPLHCIIAMTKEQNAQRKRRDMSDSHYATVSDDSDEMYAAIDDPNQIQEQLYTSGSETYAQIQPPSNQMTVSVEINTTQSQEVSSSHHQTSTVVSSNIQVNSQVNQTNHSTPLPPSIDSLKTHMHSRQASASSCSSSLGYIGSPKPEKRQANSPLPPTPKSLHKSSTSNLTSSTVTSGRNSAASVIEVSNVVGIGKMETPKHDTKKKSPSKDIEGMYAKVMKKTKLFSNLPSNDIHLNNNPEMYVSDPDITKEMNIEFEGESPGKNSTSSVDNNYETIGKKNVRRTGSLTQKDPGYETIPGESNRNNVKNDKKSRLSAPVGVLTRVEMEPGYEMLPEHPVTQTINDSDAGYEILKQTSNSDYDPNYEVLRPIDDGYARIMEKSRGTTINDGYSSIRNVKSDDLDELGLSLLDGYAKIGEKKQTNINNNVVIVDDNFYSSINPPYESLTEVKHGKSNDTNRRSFPTYSTVQEINISDAKKSTSNGTLAIQETTPQNTATPSTESFNSSSDNLLLHPLKPSDTGSLTGSDTDPNYESVRYLNVTENPYERLHSEKASPVSNDAVKISVAPPLKQSKNDVSDFFHV